MTAQPPEKRHIVDVGAYPADVINRQSKDPAAGVNGILHSGKRRAQQTAEIIREAFNSRVPMSACENLGPEGPLDAVCSDIARFDAGRIIVGHLPLLPRLVSTLVIGSDGHDIVSIPAAGVVALEQAGHGQWRIIWCVSPQQLT